MAPFRLAATIALVFISLLITATFHEQALADSEPRLISTEHVYSISWAFDSSRLYFSTAPLDNSPKCIFQCWHEYDVRTLTLNPRATDLWQLQPQLTLREIDLLSPTLGASLSQTFMYESPNYSLVAVLSPSEKDHLVIFRRDRQKPSILLDVHTGYEDYGPDSVIWSRSGSAIFIRPISGSFQYIRFIQKDHSKILQTVFTSSYPGVRIRNQKYLFKIPYAISPSEDRFIVYAERVLSDSTDNIITIPVLVLYNVVDPVDSRDITELSRTTPYAGITARFVSEKEALILTAQGISIWNLDTQNLHSIKLFRQPIEPKTAEFSPDGHWLAFISKQAELYLLRVTEEDVIFAR